jgi:hypothetical protein
VREQSAAAMAKVDGVVVEFGYGAVGEIHVDVVFCVSATPRLPAGRQGYGCSNTMTSEALGRSAHVVSSTGFCA